MFGLKSVEACAGRVEFVLSFEGECVEAVGDVARVVYGRMGRVT